MSYELGIPEGGRETFLLSGYTPSWLGCVYNTGFTCSWPTNNLIYILGLAGSGWDAFHLLALPQAGWEGLTAGINCS